MAAGREVRVVVDSEEDVGSGLAVGAGICSRGRATFLRTMAEGPRRHG